MAFTPRSPKADYIVQTPNGAHYYSRVVPARLREVFGRRQWWVPLQGRTATERETEAHALAHHHTHLIREALAGGSPGVPTLPITEASRGHNWPEPSAPIGPIWREGGVTSPRAAVVTGDPAVRREAEAAGATVLTWAEARLQEERATYVAEAAASPSPVAQRAAARMAAAVAEEIEDASRPSDAILDVAERWFKVVSQGRETRRHHLQHLREFMAYTKVASVQAITTRLVADYVAHLTTALDARGRVMSPSTAARRLDTLKALLDFAEGSGVVARNVAAKVRRPSDPRPPSDRSYQPLSPDDLVKLIAVSDAEWMGGRRSEERRADLRAALRMVMALGTRPNEVAQLRRADVDLGRRAVVITDAPAADHHRPKSLKNGMSNRVIPIPAIALGVIEQHVALSDHPLLFPTFEPVHQTASYSDVLGREWTSVIRALVQFDHPKKVLDSLRHSWAVEADRSGMPESVKHELMGHSRGPNRNATRYIINAASVDPERLGRHREFVDRMEFPGLG